MKHTFLLVGQETSAHWAEILEQALSGLGELHRMTEQEAMQADTQNRYAVIIVDAGVVSNVAPCIIRLRQKWPEARIVVATASPTWQRAREAFLSGATDYIRKVLNPKSLRSKIKRVLDNPPPPWPR